MGVALVVKCVIGNLFKKTKVDYFTVNNINNKVDHFINKRWVCCPHSEHLKEELGVVIKKLF